MTHTKSVVTSNAPHIIQILRKILDTKKVQNTQHYNKKKVHYLSKTTGRGFQIILQAAVVFLKAGEARQFLRTNVDYTVTSQKEDRKRLKSFVYVLNLQKQCIWNVPSSNRKRFFTVCWLIDFKVRTPQEHVIWWKIIVLSHQNVCKFNEILLFHTLIEKWICIRDQLWFSNWF